MGMYNELNNISRAVSSQANISESKSQKKYKLENNLLIKLEYYIRKYKDEKKDIYNVSIQDEIIQKTIRSCFGELQSQLDPNNPADFVENYQTNEEKIDEEYVYIYCMRHYLTCCRNIENYVKNEKKSNENQDEYKKQIALEKWEIQRQKELLKMKVLEQKIAQNEQKFNMNRSKQPQTRQQNRSGDATKIILYLIIAPFLLFGLVIYGFISAAAKSK